MKGITGALKDAGKLEAIGQVIDLQLMLSGLIEKNCQLTDENRARSEKLKLKDAMIFRKPLYYQDGDKAPFCPNCWESDEKAAHLIGPNCEVGDTYWWCKRCEETHYTRINGVTKELN